VGERTQIGWQLGLLRQQRSKQIDSRTGDRRPSTRHELRLRWMCSGSIRWAIDTYSGKRSAFSGDSSRPSRRPHLSSYSDRFWLSSERLRQSSAAGRRSGYAKAAACSVCHVPHQSTVRRIEAVLRSRHGRQCHCCLCLTDSKKERCSCTSPERKKLNFKRESIMIIVRLLSPEPFGLVCTTKVYSGVGADIVMESVTLLDLNSW
jgi:hypothetical protein